MVDLENRINTKLSKIDLYNKINKGANSVRSKKELFLYNSSED